MKKFILLYTCFSLLSAELVACTGIRLATKEGGYIYGRTLEFGNNLDSSVLFIPRNYSYISLVPTGKPQGLTWHSKYAALGMNIFHAPYLIDGVNEVGLAGGIFYFPGFAEYQAVTPEQYAKSLPMWSLLTLLLTTCASVAEVKQQLPTLYITNTVFPNVGTVGVDSPMHLIVHDSTGKSLVVEYLDGKLHMYDNPIGVITNSPNFDWHITNLRNYINLSPLNAKPQNLSGVVLPQLGEGSGMLGLPGDFTPPSRFVRAVAFTQAVEPAATGLDGVKQAFHILNNFDIPKQVVRDASGYQDFTAWTSVTDMLHKTYYFKTYDSFQIHTIALADMDLDAKTTQEFSINYPDQFLDVLNS